MQLPPFFINSVVRLELLKLMGNQWFIKSWSYRLSKNASVLREILRGRGG